MATSALSTLGRARLRNALAVSAAAVVGGLGTKPASAWYRSLDKPAWQPPGWVFGPVWTTLYALIADGTARARLATTDPGRRRQDDAALAANLALNTAWSWLFFTAQRPGLALAEVLVLDVSTLDLHRRAQRADPAAGNRLLPYAAWVLFATALNAAIVRRNRT